MKRRQRGESCFLLTGEVNVFSVTNTVLTQNVDAVVVLVVSKTHFVYP